MMLKITKRFRFSDFDKYRKGNGKKFSKAFKDMVASCLDQDPSKRPTVISSLKHPFFKSVRSRFSGEERSPRVARVPLPCLVKERRIGGWNFNQDGLELDPVFPNDDAVAKEVAFGREAGTQQMGEHVYVGGGATAASIAGGGGVKKEKMLA
ncbi:unnamed protein product [Sphenostylis stenocarpa]|uniref:Uncharacterized protein n=1 Tax=Sphenostylis stenocarpa TaxID=92480 RepID=A0AA87B774_9FABA|nr:unnamed protein product [Sphenostylis stenocarpa]